jgi:hypothetical protein
MKHIKEKKNPIEIDFLSGQRILCFPIFGQISLNLGCEQISPNLTKLGFICSWISTNYLLCLHSVFTYNHSYQSSFD